MRKRDPRHQTQVDSIHALSSPELIRRIGIHDHHDAQHIASEVLATLIRNRVDQTGGVLNAAVEELNRRIQILVGKRMLGMMGQPEVKRRGDQALPDTIDYVWQHFFEETVEVSNSEVRFAVYVRDRVDDFMRHLRTHKNSMESADTMDMGDQGGSNTPLSETVEEEELDGPEQSLMRKQQSAKVVSTLMSLPEAERNAFYCRAEFQYEWKEVAAVLSCSIPTARKHFAAAKEKLEGALDE
jgi:RNA polymerase sigma factor (sigma-70 family)